MFKSSTAPRLLAVALLALLATPHLCDASVRPDLPNAGAAAPHAVKARRIVKAPKPVPTPVPVPAPAAPPAPPAPETCSAQLTACVANNVCIRSFQAAVELWQDAQAEHTMSSMGSMASMLSAPTMGSMATMAMDEKPWKYKDAQPFLASLISSISLRTAFAAEITGVVNAPASNLLACAVANAPPTPTPAPTSTPTPTAEPTPTPTPSPLPARVTATLELEGVDAGDLNASVLTALEQGVADQVGVDASNVNVSPVTKKVASTSVFVEIFVPAGGAVSTSDVTGAITATSSLQTSVNTALAAASTGLTVSAINASGVYVYDPNLEDTDTDI